MGGFGSCGGLWRRFRSELKAFILRFMSIDSLALAHCLVQGRKMRKARKQHKQMPLNADMTRSLQNRVDDSHVEKPQVSFQDAEIAPETAQPSTGHMAPKAAVKEVESLQLSACGS
ncbi:hypothetical protein AK812_SmicGene16041 [Symbiodinium microadriaticum]|uniref:Uncharacterized protein n=1 Tax=Symbiodinium microadriaticum TaxID=2951 RepID=A0A1Q9E1E2_SYMMI|nr:hypothetical protein AK812_SmicGene16041 [Symbiodinium microadriaticum]